MTPWAAVYRQHRGAEGWVARVGKKWTEVFSVVSEFDNGVATEGFDGGCVLVNFSGLLMELEHVALHLDDVALERVALAFSSASAGTTLAIVRHRRQFLWRSGCGTK
jgi:hypothetical protein